MQKTFDTERAAWVNDKKTLEGTIFDMTTSEKSVESDRASRESEIRQQEERAKAAEERYSREVIAHAEAIKTVEELRQQLNKALTTARDNQAASETAQAKLTTSETSWKQQKEALDKEVADLNTRYVLELLRHCTRSHFAAQGQGSRCPEQPSAPTSRVCQHPSRSYSSSYSCRTVESTTRDWSGRLVTTYRQVC